MCMNNKVDDTGSSGPLAYICYFRNVIPGYTHIQKGRQMLWDTLRNCLIGVVWRQIIFINRASLRSINQERLVNVRIATSKISVNRYGRNIFPWNGKQTTTKCLLLWAATCGHLHRQFLTFFLSWSLFFVSIFAELKYYSGRFWCINIF